MERGTSETVRFRAAGCRPYGYDRTALRTPSTHLSAAVTAHSLECAKGILISCEAYIAAAGYIGGKDKKQLAFEAPAGLLELPGGYVRAVLRVNQQGVTITEVHLYTAEKGHTQLRVTA